MTYQESIRYLESFIDYEKKSGYNYDKSFKIERMQRLSSLLGDPHKGIRSIHVAGSKGKGSTSVFIYSILQKAGFRTGLYTSPHLNSFRERIRINDLLIEEEDICLLAGRIKDVVEGFKGGRPSFFEVYTALAYMYFKNKGVDFAVYETGMGGRLDATNIIEPLVSVITPISYEHTEKLGDTLSKIAGEKAGIIKADSICVSAPQEKEALDVIKDRCRAKKTKLILAGEDIIFKEIEATYEKEVFSVGAVFRNYDKLETRLVGYHQVINAATAIGAIEALRLRGVDIPSGAVEEGIRQARWEGRMETVSNEPLVILDGAHNSASAKTLAAEIKRLFKYKKLILILGVSKDKDVKGIAENLIPISDIVILTKSRVIGRAMEPESIRGVIGDHEKLYITGTVEEAVGKARLMADNNNMILITGSLFVVGEARTLFVKEDKRYEKV